MADRRIAFFILALLWASPALAQTTTEPIPDPSAEAPIRFGPLSLKSTIALSNIGIDTNVFNAASNDNPQSDFTMTFTPVTDMWLRMGRTWISGRIDVDWVYYETFASERSANADYLIGAARTFNRLALNGSARYLSTRERPGFEIDARSDRTETEWDGSIEMRALPQTYFGARAWRRRVAFDRDEVFRGANLAEELNRTIDAQAFTVRHVLTSLTAVSLQVGREEERFTLSSLRDADSNRVAGTATFQPRALISGNATVGYRQFTPRSADVPALSRRDDRRQSLVHASRDHPFRHRCVTRCATLARIRAPLLPRDGCRRIRAAPGRLVLSTFWHESERGGSPTAIAWASLWKYRTVRIGCARSALAQDIGSDRTSVSDLPLNGRTARPTYMRTGIAACDSGCR